MLIAIVLTANAWSHTKILKTREMENYHFNNVDDGIVFLALKKLVIHVDAQVAPNKPSDGVTVYFSNGHNHRVAANTTREFKENGVDFGSFQIAPEDFKNGAKGHYEFISRPGKNRS